MYITYAHTRIYMYVHVHVYVNIYMYTTEKRNSSKQHTLINKISCLRKNKLSKSISKHLPQVEVKPTELPILSGARGSSAGPHMHIRLDLLVSHLRNVHLSTA